MSQQEILSFAGIFSKVDFIEIPVIQRDYAQGRQSAHEIRQQFLNTLAQALHQDAQSEPLVLDFIYGSIEEGSPSRLSVLDGQQRLTTLFLLHWFLAAKEGEYQAFCQRFTLNGKSRFSYKTRTSATEFFDALVSANPENYQFSPDAAPIDEQLIDSHWFYLSWRHDPTIESCLTMLRALQQRFSAPADSLFQRLCSEDDRRIVFHYLSLQYFGLSDDLYIKMNARGKALTDFEHFKAWLSGHTGGWPAAETFSQKLDGRWTDLFWQIRDKDHAFDTLYLRFFMRMAFLLECERSDKRLDALGKEDAAWFSLLRDTQGTFAPLEFEQHRAFAPEDLAKIMQVLDYFPVGQATPAAGEAASAALLLLTDFVTTSDYLVQARFYALALFILTQEKPDNDEAQHQQRWLRFTDNLLNTLELDAKNFIRVLAALKAMAPYARELYDWLEHAPIPAIFKDQWEEERLKVGLIQQDLAWEAALIRAEHHPYLQGRIRGLLNLARSPTHGTHSLKKFITLTEKTFRVLDKAIIEHKAHLLERALLTLGDYLVPVGNNRFTFCRSANHSWRDRHKGWMAVVERPVFGQLLAHIGTQNVTSTLQKLIAQVNCGGWRELIVKYPQVISYAKERLLDKEDEKIYLLSKSTRRAYFFELHGYVLAERLQQRLENGDLSVPIKAVEHRWTYGDDEPWLELTLDNDQIRYAYYSQGKYEFWKDGESEGKKVPQPRYFPALLEELMPEIYAAD
ncbi:DUF262 domain-containing protein [Mixta intestinalis]|uniref:GmrSD restriction endonucleases N-terminal domain-containing protein n=1 Tax=Mixta intestinalis TaxID=1615494 RepID=A0A6P1Q376_9GAMM|nr:DUF262 domain-containing protein [Mixta intestinalis]QHM73376.1 hypothetical protein C7M51_03723 [Mixta intestinalis]